MAFDPEMTFNIGPNNKGNNPKRPDYRGELFLGGKKYQLSGWIRENKARGTQFISGRVQLAEEKRPGPASTGFEVEKAPAIERKPAPPVNDDPQF